MKTRVTRGAPRDKAGLDHPKVKKRAPLDRAPSAAARATQPLDREVVANLAEAKSKARAKSKSKSETKSEAQPQAKVHRRSAPQVSAIPEWPYDPATGLTIPARAKKRPPGCLIARAGAGTAFPPALAIGQATYRHLRNGFYIGAHASDRDIAGLFDRLAPTYEQGEINVGYNLAVYRQLTDRARTAAAIEAPERVLDFGCGTGVGLDAIVAAAPAAEVLGFDLSPKMRAIAAERGMLPVDEQNGRLELGDRSVDLVVGAFLLHLVQSPEWIAEVARVLRPGGAASFNVYKPVVDWHTKYGAWFKDAGLEVVSAAPATFSGGGMDVTMPLMVVRRPAANAP
ncbi:MAG: class I SAM-dependent methyltransferase [Deltaproteobacteria bacterium]|nr:class I SAM-dependent methyltransferase [Deltaproteobacteria bacterium]